MIGDSDSESGNRDDRKGTRDSAYYTEEAPGRALRGWARSYTPEQSMWSRLRTRVVGLFARNHSAAQHDSTERSTREPVASNAQSGIDDTAVISVSPPGDYGFPWTRREAAPAAPDVSFSSVEDALPVSEERLDAPARSQYPDITLFGAHDERIEAAADALDQAAVEVDGSTVGGRAPGGSFGSVDDALPAADPALSDFTVDSKTDEYEAVAAVAQPSPGGEEPTLELSPARRWRDKLLGRFFRTRPSEAAPAEAREGEAPPSAGFLFAKFRAFYNEVIRFQHQKSEFSAGFATAMIADGEDPGPETAANALSRRLCELLELQAAEAKWMGGEAAERYPDAQYVMAALADEVFTYSEWEGQSAWPKYRLEQRIYRTHAAEVDVFARIDTLLKDAPETAVARDLARVYLLVLAAGFLGKWRPFGLTRAVAEYRRRLYEYIHSGDALLLYASDRRVFPDAVSRTLEGHAVARFSAAQRWAAILAVLATIYFVVAHVAWSSSSSDLRDVTSRIKSLAPDGP
ncbi:MAG TPA: DotU family type IV/VI secretion system protein [Gemmatimonadaceae bacterium]|nr:DotU family type IV/VI secretion system protein [Gemmatimonadaceae bacterium]